MTKRHALAALLAASVTVAGCDDITGAEDFLRCDEVRRIQLPAVVDGDLTGGDCRLPEDGTPVDYYAFTLGSTRTVYIDMESDEIDSYLQLLDEDGFVVDEDDEGGRFEFDASLAVRLSPGRYYIAANSYDGDVGRYQLYVED